MLHDHKFEEMAENDDQRTLALRAPRGTLFDGTGPVLWSTGRWDIAVREQTGT